MFRLTAIKALSSTIDLDSPEKWLKTRLASTQRQMRRFLKRQGDEHDFSGEEEYRDQLYLYLQGHHLGAGLAGLDKVAIEPRIVIPKELWNSDKNRTLDSGRLYDSWPDLVDEIALAPPPNCTIRQLLQQGERVIISGKDGTGKTTLLAFLALLCLNQRPSKKHFFLKGTLPVFIHLAELDQLNQPEIKEDADGTSDPIAILSGALSDRFDKISREDMDSLLRSKLCEGELVLLIDGWDELPPNGFAPYVKWLSRFLELYPYCQVIAAGPIHGLGPLISLGFMVSGSLAWRKGQAEAFYQVWSDQLQSEQLNSSEEYWLPGQTAIETFLRLSLLLAGERSFAGNKPARKVELLEAALGNVFTPVRSDASDQWLMNATREFWHYLAFTMVKNRQLFTSGTDVREIARTVLKSYLSDIDESAINQLLSTLKESGLYVFYPNERLGFLSPVVRDYLAAVYIARSSERDQAGNYFDDQYWSGVLKFVAGRIGAMSLLKQLHTAGRKLTEADLFTLAEWLPEAQDHRQWRRQILIGLGQIILNNERPIIMRQRAVVLMAKSGEEGVSDLLNQLLSKPETAIRQIALAALARISPLEAIPLNERMMSDFEEVIRVATIYSLAWIDDDSTVKPLIKALVEPDELVQEAAATALALNSSTTSREILGDALAAKTTSVRLAVVHGLSRVEEDWSIKLLADVAETDEYQLVKSAAEQALLRIKDTENLEKWRPTRGGEQQWLIDWALARGEIVPVGPAAVPLILEALSDEEASIRSAAVRTLAALSIKEAIDPVFKLLSDPDPEVRSAADYASRQLERAWGTAP